MTPQEIIKQAERNEKWFAECLTGADPNQIADIYAHLKSAEYRANPNEKTWWESLHSELHSPKNHF